MRIFSSFKENERENIGEVASVRLMLAPTARPPEEAARAASHCCAILPTLKELWEL